MYQLDELLAENPTITQSEYALAILRQGKLPRYVKKVSIHRVPISSKKVKRPKSGFRQVTGSVPKRKSRSILKINVWNVKGIEIFGFIHVTTTPQEYSRRRKNRRYSKAILIVKNQQAGRTRANLIRLIRELHQHVTTASPKVKREKRRQRRINPEDFED